MSNIQLNIDKNYFLPHFYPNLYDYSKRYNIFYGGRGSGKTHYIIRKLLIKGLREKRFILLMKKTTAAVKDSVWKELLDAIEELKLTPYFSFNRSEFRATCNINGTEYRCLGLDTPEKAKGWASVSDVYLDEATDFTPNDIDVIDGTLRSKKYTYPIQLYFSFNPVAKTNFCYKYFHFDTGEFPPDFFVDKSTYLDNSRCHILHYLENLKLRDYNRYKVEALGDWGTLNKLVYENWEVKDFNYQDIKGELILGLDFGFSVDKTAFIASILNEQDKTIHIFDSFGATNMLNSDIATEIVNHGFAKSIIIADAAEPKSIVELKKLGIERVKASVKGPDSINAGIAKLKEYHIYVSPLCGEVIDEFQSYCYQKDKQTGEYINKPEDCNNHYMDALRYSIQCLPAKIKTFSKDTLF